MLKPSAEKTSMGMTGAERVFVDTNILVHANNEDSIFHQAAQKTLLELQARGVEFWISRQVLREYAVIISRKMNEKKAFNAAALNGDLKRFASEFVVADEDAQVTQILMSLIKSHDVKGKPIHDANIVATMLAKGLSKLLTQNVKDFERYEPLIEIFPLNVVA